MDFIERLPQSRGVIRQKSYKKARDVKSSKVPFEES